MKLITESQRQRMLSNGKASAECGGCDCFPEVKLFTPDAHGTWLLSEIDPDNHDLAFGLCDLGHPELGWVSLTELASVRGPLGLPIERDLHFSAEHRISVYAQAARVAGTIVTDDRSLSAAKAALDAERRGGGL